jgi:Ni/Co efflux regulator RcnB
VQAQSVRPHHRANAYVAVAQQHALEKVRPRKVSHHRMAARHLETVDRRVLGDFPEACRRGERFPNRYQS